MKWIYLRDLWTRRHSWTATGDALRLANKHMGR